MDYLPSKQYNKEKEISDLEKKAGKWDIISCVILTATLFISSYFFFMPELSSYNYHKKEQEHESKKFEMDQKFTNFQIRFKNLEEAKSAKEFNLALEDLTPDKIEEEIGEFEEFGKEYQKFEISKKEYQKNKNNPGSTIKGLLLFLLGICCADYCNEKTNKYEKKIGELRKTKY